MDQEIRSFLGKLRRWLGLQKALDIFPIFLSFGFLMAFLHVFFGYFHPFYYAGSVSFLWILASLTAGFIYCCIHFPKETDAAHTGDQAIGHERLLTSLELRGNDSAISRLQKEDTLSHITKCSLRESFPYHFPIKRMAVSFLAVFLFLTFLILPSDAKLRASKLHEIKQKAKTETALLEKLQKELQEEKELEEKGKTAKSPETIGGKLNAHGKFDTVNNLLEKAKTNYASAASEKDLERANISLYSKLLDLETKAGSNSYDEQEALSSLIKKIRYTPEYADLSDQQTSGNNSISGKNAASDNTGTTSASGTNTENTMNNAGNPEHGSSDQSPTSNTVSGSNGNSENQDPDSSENQTTGNSGNPGGKLNKNSNPSKTDGSPKTNDEPQNTQNDKQGTESKEQTDSQKNNNENGNGNKNNSGTGTGNNGNGNGTGKNYGSKQGIERKSNTSQTPEQVTIMEEAIGNDKKLTGTASENGNSQTQSSDAPLSFGTKKNFDDVVSDYANSAYTAIQNNKIPSSMANVVQSYFSDLNS